ncbi:MAG: transposase [Phycisphaerae bacterium]
MANPRIRRALISVYDKTGIVDFARALHAEFGIEIISTGGTASLLKENDIPVTLVEEITGFPEMLDGRVKTLHPKIHAAILADRDKPEHMKQLAEAGIEPIDMVVVNLYPFERTIAKPDCTFEQAIEMIDIGGPCLLRAAAKNHKHVLVVYGPSWYAAARYWLRNWDNSELRDAGLLKVSRAAFAATTEYDASVASWLSRDEESQKADLRHFMLLGRRDLRYGENPHQYADAYQLSGDLQQGRLTTSDAGDDSAMDVSFNNYADADAALRLCCDLSSALTALCGTGFQPVEEALQSPESKYLEDEQHTRRNLPHIQVPGKTYFVTFRLKEQDVLSAQERTIVLDACRFWDQQKIDVHAAVVMPDHVHLLFSPREVSPEQWVTLGEVMHSIKRYTAHRINKDRGRIGSLWLDESFDRIIRNEKEYCEKADYIANNPVKEGLAEKEPYPWWWDEREHRGVTRAGQPSAKAHRLETGATSSVSKAHRLETGATSSVSKAHRLETGATQGATHHAHKLLATCVFIKHTNACGVGLASDPVEAYRKAYLGDPNAAMGGILACDFDVTQAFAERVMDTFGAYGKEAGAGGFFIEVWVAPAFEVGAVETIRGAKKWGSRVRLLSVDVMDRQPEEHVLEYKSIAGGMLAQTRDVVSLNEDEWKTVTSRRPTDRELTDLRLAWLVCKHTKSNAISICRDGMLIGNGAGQMSRVMSCRIATWLANDNGHAEKLKGAVAASDAFFPFRDGPDLLTDAGVSAIIQPGGSKRDDEVIAACNERGVAMIFTGTRHFKH